MRTKKGEPRAKLTNETALLARRLFQEGAGYKAIADQLGVCENNVRKVVKGQTWKNVPGAIPDPEKRHARGEGIRNSKITRDQVVKARSLYKDGASHQAIADITGLSHRNVVDVVKGKTWKHLPGAIPERESSRNASTGSMNHMTDMEEEDIEEIGRMYAAGKSYKEIGARFRIAKSKISKIMRGKTWKHVNIERPTRPYAASQGSRHHHAKLNENKVAEIKALLLLGATLAELATKFDTCFQNISQIKNGKTWAQVDPSPHIKSLPRLGTPPTDTAKVRPRGHRVSQLFDRWQSAAQELGRALRGL